MNILGGLFKIMKLLPISDITERPPFSILCFLKNSPWDLVQRLLWSLDATELAVVNLTHRICTKQLKFISDYFEWYNNNEMNIEKHG